MHSLGIKTNECSNESYGLKNSVEFAIKQHPSFNLVNENITNNEIFYFSPTEQESILKEIINLDNKKIGTLKKHSYSQSQGCTDICTPILANT